MVNGVVDSAILIDILRDFQPAKEWLANQKEPLGITRVVWLEVLQGINSKSDGLQKSRVKLQEALKLLESFEVIPIENEDHEWATEKMVQLKLTHDNEAFDLLIAGTAIRLQVPVYTPNRKHYQPLLEDLAVRPY